MTLRVSEPYHSPERRRKRTNKDWAFAVREGNITEVHRFYTRQEAKTEADRLRQVKRASH